MDLNARARPLLPRRDFAGRRGSSVGDDPVTEVGSRIAYHYGRSSMRLPISLTLALLALAPSALADCLYPYWAQSGNVLVPPTPRAVATADLDGDGKPDAVGSTAESVHVAMGNGDGTLGAAATIYTGTLAWSVVAAELTGGGGIDVAVIDTALGAIVLLPGNGDGTFGSAVTTTLPAGTMPDWDPQEPWAPRIRVADFDEDGANDLALALADDVRIYERAGGGMFAAAATLAAAAPPTVILPTDIDSDGNVDMLVGSAYSNVPVLEIHYGNGDGTFASIVVQPAFYGPERLSAVDLDADGDRDLVALQTTQQLSIMRNLTGRTFGDPLNYTPQRTLYGLATGELNGDGRPDALAVGSGSAVAFMGSGTGTMQRLSSGFIYGTMTDVALADFDADGRLDALVPRSYATDEGAFSVLRNRCGDSLMTFDASQVVTAGSTSTIEVLVRGADGTLAGGSVTLREGDAVFGTQTLSAGRAKFQITLPVGTHVLTADYSGEAQHEPNSATFTQTATTATTTTTVAYPATTEFGRLFVATATITSTLPGTPTGALAWYVDGVLQPVYGSPPNVLYRYDLPVGAHTIEVRYKGDATHPASSSGVLPLTVTKATPQVGTTPDAAKSNTPFTFRVLLSRVDSSTSAANPTGNVTVSRAGIVLGTRPATTAPYDEGYPAGALPAGRHYFRVQYAGDANYVPYDNHFLVVVGDSATPNFFEARGTASLIRVAAPGGGSIYRRVPGGTWEYVSYGAGMTDTSGGPGSIYLYRLNNAGPIDIGMRVSFTDDPELAGVAVRAIHMTEIVSALNALRAAAGLGATTLSITPGAPVHASDVLALRTAINEARTALGAYAFAFSGDIAAGEPVRALHFQELREAIR